MIFLSFSFGQIFLIFYRIFKAKKFKGIFSMISVYKIITELTLRILFFNSKKNTTNCFWVKKKEWKKSVGIKKCFLKTHKIALMVLRHWKSMISLWWSLISILKNIKAQIWWSFLKKSDSPWIFLTRWKSKSTA